MDQEKIIFSVIKEDFSRVRDFVLNSYEIDKTAVNVSELSLENMDSIIPKNGGAHYPVYGIWSSYLSGVTFFKSNYTDGLVNLTRHIGNKLGCDVLNVAIVEEYYSLFKYEYLRENGSERVIQLLKDTQWEFNQLGDPLDYERLEVYRKRKKVDRLNKDLIEEYLAKENVFLNRISNEMVEGILVERIKWN